MSKEAEAAINTLKFLGYTYHGGEKWKPPLGPKPDFWEGYVPEPVKPAQCAPAEDGVCEALDCSNHKPAQQALDKKAENARELGLDYEPAQPYKSIADHINQATNGRVKIDPVTGDVGIGTPSSQPAQRTWVGLVWGELPEDGQNHDFLRGAVWAETKLKEKNQ